MGALNVIGQEEERYGAEFRFESFWRLHNPQLCSRFLADLRERLVGTGQNSQFKTSAIPAADIYSGGFLASSSALSLALISVN